MLHELVFSRCHSQFTSYPYTFASYSYSCKILQPYVAATVRTHSDAVLSSTGALLMKTVIESNRQQQMVCFLFGRIRLPDTCESAFTTVVCESWTVGDKSLGIMLEILAANIHGWVLSRTFCLGGEVDPEKKFWAKQLREKLYFIICRGVREHAPPENFENIVFRIGWNRISGH